MYNQSHKLIISLMISLKSVDLAQTLLKIIVKSENYAKKTHNFDIKTSRIYTKRSIKNKKYRLIERKKILSTDLITCIHTPFLIPPAWAPKAPPGPKAQGVGRG